MHLRQFIKKKAFVDCTKYINKAKIMCLFLKGYGAAIATYGPFVGIYFACYEQIKRGFQKFYGVASPDEIPFAVNISMSISL